MTPRTLLIYKENKDREDRQKKIAADVSSWMTGTYVLSAIGCALDSKNEYPESNMFFSDEKELTEEEKEEIIKENTQIAASNFAAWVEVANKSHE